MWGLFTRYRNVSVKSAVLNLDNGRKNAPYYAHNMFDPNSLNVF
jgi:hypothetical protein